MAMTKRDQYARAYLANQLREQGFATYADLFELFEFWYFDPAEYMYSDPELSLELAWSVGWMDPAKGRICVNSTLEEHQQLLTIRHEILHEYLDHELRLLEHLAKKFPDIAKAEKEQDIPDITLRDILYKNKIFNYAADYEISNRGYSDQDKEDMRRIKLNGQIVSGLITEDKHPDWINLTVEEMYDLLVDEMEKNKADPNKDNGNGENSDDDNWDDYDPDQPPMDPQDAPPGAETKNVDVKIIPGSLKHGRFYDQQGNDITPEGKK